MILSGVFCYKGPWFAWEGDMKELEERKILKCGETATIHAKFPDLVLFCPETLLLCDTDSLLSNMSILYSKSTRVLGRGQPRLVMASYISRQLAQTGAIAMIILLRPHSVSSNFLLQAARS